MCGVFGIHGCYAAVAVCWLLGVVALSLLRVQAVPVPKSGM